MQVFGGRELISRLPEELVNKIGNLFSVISKKEALTVFLSAREGLKAETDTPQKMGLTRKRYYTRLKQLIETGLIHKYGDKYVHTTLGSLVYKEHILRLLEDVRNVKQMKIIDALKNNGQFSGDEIAEFVDKISGTIIGDKVSLSTNILWSYEDIVSAIVKRIESCRNEVLLATRFFNETIINNILHKVKSGVRVRVLADTSLVKHFLEIGLIHKTDDRLDVVNASYPANVLTQLAKIPFCMILLDGKEVGIELIDLNDPQRLNGLVFIKDGNTIGAFTDFYRKLWDGASEDIAKLLESGATIEVAEVVGTRFA